MNDASGMEIHVSCVYSQIVGMMMMKAKTFLLDNEFYLNFLFFIIFIIIFLYLQISVFVYVIFIKNKRNVCAVYGLINWVLSFLSYFEATGRSSIQYSNTIR